MSMNIRVAREQIRGKEIKKKGNKIANEKENLLQTGKSVSHVKLKGTYNKKFSCIVSK